MTRKTVTEKDQGVRLFLKEPKNVEWSGRNPVHVVYGGADRFRDDTVQKFGRLGLAAMDEYAPDFAAFAKGLGLKGSDGLPDDGAAVGRLISGLNADASAVRDSNFPAWFAWSVHNKTVEKLTSEPVEDFRIDFEDGYGFRPDAAEDADAVAAAIEFASAFANGGLPQFCGIRVKPLSAATAERSLRTLDIFMTEALKRTGKKLPADFVVTLPKITEKKEVKRLVSALQAIESENGLPTRSIGVEVMIETPQSLIDKKGRFAPAALVVAAKGRCTSVHFGAYDYTADLGIAAEFQSIDHPACDFARQIMLATLSPLGVRLSDSVTTVMPVAVHKGESLSEIQRSENAQAVREAWRMHFANVTRSMVNGFFQSWDLHPAQLVGRYAAVYSFYLSGMSPQAARLRSFVDRATRATLTGNTFDDAASAEGLMNFFRRGLDCRAFSEAEVEAETGLSAEQIRFGSFAEIAVTDGATKGVTKGFTK